MPKRLSAVAWLLGLWLVATLLVIARDPTVIIRPQFYAEDGSVWYADAYNLGGLKALAIPDGAYLNTLPRLAALFALLVPFSLAPLVLNVAGIIFQTLPALFLMSSRFSKLAPVWVRATLVCLYLLLPNSREVNVVITNAQFHLALLSFLVVCASPARQWKWRVFDILVIALGAVSGPFDIALLPLLILYWWTRKDSWTLWLGAVMLPLVGMQAYEILAATEHDPAANWAQRPPGFFACWPDRFMLAASLARIALPCMRPGGWF